MSDPAVRVALIGLGNMGTPIGSRWISGGYSVVGADLSAAARDEFEGRGGTCAPDAETAAAGADVVVLLLPDSNAVDAVIGQLLDAGALRPGATVIDMSSSDPVRTQRNGDLLARNGVGFIDAPVSGGVRGAESGSLTVMAGGVADVLERQRPMLDQLGRVVHVGGIGAGHAVKALNNLLSAIHLWATSEAVLIGESFGVDAATLLEAVNGSSGRSASSEVKWPKFILTESFDSGFSARLMLKDARIATDLAESSGLPTRLGEVLVREWAAASADLPADADHTEVARWLRDRAPQQLDARV